MRTDLREFLAAKFNLNLTFVQRFILLTKNQKFYRLHYVLKDKIFTVFR